MTRCNKKALAGCHKSWTIWFNAGLLALLPMVEYAHDNYTQLEPFLGADTYKLVGLIVVIANIVLRFKTTSSLSEK